MKRTIWALLLVPLIALAASFSDPFSGSGALGVEWTACQSTGLTQSGGDAFDATGGASRASCLTGVSLTNDQYAEAVLALNQGAGRYASVMVRTNGVDGTLTGYQISIGGTNEWYISELGGSDLASGTITWAIGDTVRIEANGTEICLILNTVEVDCVNDATYTSGSAGMATYWEGSAIGFASFSAGDLGGGGGSSVPVIYQSMRQHKH